MQCENLGTYEKVQLGACQDECIENQKCNAIIQDGESDICNLRDCPWPIPEPLMYNPPYYGYYRVSGSKQEIYN